MEPEWDLLSYVDPSPYARTHPYTLLVLNHPIRDSVNFRNLWKRASRRVAADGGANHLVPLFTSLDPPCLDAIVGDLDSVTPLTRAFFANTHSPPEVVCIRDDLSTDFTKAVGYIRDVAGQGERMIALGGLGGRVDQAFSVMHHMVLLQHQAEHHNTITLVGDGNVTVLMPAGESTVRVKRSAHQDARIRILERSRASRNNETPDTTGSDGASDSNTALIEALAAPSDIESPTAHFGRQNFLPHHLHVGIMPMRKKAILTTKGLHWDVSSWTTEIGGQLSTSNRVAVGAELVCVGTSAPVLFTVQLYEEN